MNNHKLALPSTEELFWSKVAKTETCWLWTAGVLSSGHGQFRPAGRTSMTAHRYAYELARGPVPPGMEVCHNCPGGDNKLCVRPDHMFLATKSQHIRDTLSKQQIDNQQRLSRLPRGAGHYKAVLTAEQALLIRDTPTRPGVVSALARQFGVSKTTISAIRLRKIWKSLPD